MKINQKKVDRIVSKKLTPCPACGNPLSYTTTLDKHKMLWGLTTCRMNTSHYTLMKGLGKVKL